MIWFVAYISSVAGAFLSIVAITMIRHEERHNVGRLGWLGLVLLSPPIGLILFLWLGGRKISAEHSQRKLVDLPPAEAASVPAETSLEKLLETRGLRRPTVGNEIQLLDDTRDVLEAYLRLIEEAKDTIYIMTFIMDERKGAQRIVDQLCRRARDGVQVRLLCDGFGSFQMSDTQLEQIRAAGGRAERFKPMSQLSRLAYLNFRNHRKLAVVDARKAILGGANLVEEELDVSGNDNRWVDMSVQIEGPAAAQLQAVFCSDWNFVTEEQLPPTDFQIDERSVENTANDQRTRMTTMPIGPDGPEEILEDFWDFMIHRAEERIWICTPYFVPTSQAISSLEAACRRGIDVRILVPENSDLRPVDYARIDYMNDLEYLGGKIYRYQDAMVHAKVGIIDQSAALVGSANFDVRSFFLNYELSVVVHDQPTIKRFSDWYESLLPNCDEGVPETTTWRATLGLCARLFASEL
ncbi:phospholipase D-like domain-containing protein [Rhodopirellula halodulae]|uniref:phospholipase D-like domain-containing protein n=1 Tax=Rhodopirellula halodulae TaxID=2894198 RepID=UPI001E340546|nr:phospholipase D-like domain-containing protein [Rhodopirellula sp. JC737]MCC9658092.1 phospholipase D-like domain-containing protein [Rhodopirellula sp. JC737]